MLFEKTVTVKAPLGEVLDFLWDPERLASCIQGCEKVKVIEEKSRYAALVAAKVGPFKANFAIELEVMEVEALHIKAKAAGKDSSLAASLKADIDLKLKDVSEQGTELDFKTDVNMVGKLATLGHWIIKKKADETMTYFVDRIKAQLEKS
jgi:carbon monoxide dehydrogenase subunit G